MSRAHAISIDEEQRQLVLLALAMLSLERPGFEYALTNIALLIDNHQPDGTAEMYEGFKALNSDRVPEVARLRQWVADLQSGMWINCVYCGHRYGPNPGTPVSMADVLKAHIEVCPEHPASKLKAALVQAVDLIRQWYCMGLLDAEMAKVGWDLYRNAAPEMRPILDALKGGAS